MALIASFSECILLHNPQQRPTIDQILKCEWLHQRAKPPPSPLNEARNIIARRKKASFWCNKSRKTSPISPLSVREAPVEPVESYTKKYNNVPIEKFKNPLESFNASATTVIPIHNHSNIYKRNNSLINSSKIIPKRNPKNGHIEIVQDNDIIQVRSYSQDEPSENSMESSDDYDKFMMLPSKTNKDDNQLRALHPMELEARKILRTLGIEDEALEKAIEHGPRSEVIGIYRIVIMRLKTQKEQALISQQSPVSSNDKLKNDHNHKLQQAKKQNATRCAIL